MGIIINDDFMIYILMRYVSGFQPRNRKEAEEDIHAYIEKYRGSQVTDWFFNMNCQLSYSPSDVWESAECRYQKKEVDGNPVDYTDSHLSYWHRVCTELGVDLYERFLAESRNCGIHPWLSFRVNDVHATQGGDGETFASDYVHNARKNNLIRCRHRTQQNYFDDARDFSLNEVRENLLDYVKEQIFRYDADGIELDFMREPYCSRPGYEDEGREIIHSMMQEIRLMTEKRAEELGHPLKIAVRTFRDIQSDWYSGVDAVGLSQSGLVDMVIPSPRWETCDNAIPVEMWHNALSKNTRLSIGTDIQYRSHPERRQLFAVQQLFGLANQFLSEGADDVYLFNYHYSMYENSTDATTSPHSLRKVSSDQKKDLPIEKIAGSLETLKNVPRRHTVSYQDVAAFGEMKYHPLPVTLTEEFYYLRIPTGQPDDTMWLLLGTDCKAEQLTVYLNSALLTYVGETDVEPSYSETPVKVYKADVLRPIHQMLELHDNDSESCLYFVELRTQKPEIR